MAVEYSILSLLDIKISELLTQNCESTLDFLYITSIWAYIISI